MTTNTKPANANQLIANLPVAKQGDCILITGATGFIGRRVVENLLERGFQHIRCMVRPTSNVAAIARITELSRPGQQVEVVKGNLLSPEDCVEATRDAVVVLHLAAARGEKSIPTAYMNSVLTTRNLMEATRQHGCLKRLVNVSSFAVYTNTDKPVASMLDESCPVETQPQLRGDAYSFAKIKQDEMVEEYGKKYGVPYVIVRPGYVYGPGNEAITSRVGFDTFGVFLHLGGPNPVPMTYVENCADAIVAAGLAPDINGEAFNIVDDDLPSSRQFLRLYKKNVKPFRSYYVPHALSYALCSFWEWYSNWSEGQLPPAYSRRVWNNAWRKTRYSNEKLKARTGWVQRIPTTEGMKRYFEACRTKEVNA